MENQRPNGGGGRGNGQGHRQGQHRHQGGGEHQPRIDVLEHIRKKPTMELIISSPFTRQVAGEITRFDTIMSKTDGVFGRRLISTTRYAAIVQETQGFIDKLHRAVSELEMFASGRNRPGRAGRGNGNQGQQRSSQQLPNGGKKPHQAGSAAPQRIGDKSTQTPVSQQAGGGAVTPTSKTEKPAKTLRTKKTTTKTVAPVAKT